MREMVGELRGWVEAEMPFALATVVATWHSSPRQPGAVMAVAASGEVLGSVSGGCVEGALYDLAQQVIASGTPVLETYGVSDDDAFAVGLTCGGVLEVLVEPVLPASRGAVVLARTLDAIVERRSVASVTLLGPDADSRDTFLIGATETTESLPATLPPAGSRQLADTASAEAQDLLSRGETGILHLQAEDGSPVPVVVRSFVAPPLMLIFGASDFARALSQMGAFLGYHVVVCDARGVFATAKRFPAADEVVVTWPHRYLEQAQREGRVDHRTAICVLTHDAKFDVPVLVEALAGPAAYIGAMGSRRTHAHRVARLREHGVSDLQLARISSPLGLDLGGETPEETAVSIAAEIVMLTRGGTPTRLVAGDRAIHR
ncbi:XdhC/CoxI family protein [Nocardioides sp.]|uniref:XdhC family protein n=1 Tax=Nocardioides sp. TaxID=35761 RepID=UPI00262A3511|nr:XdhC/CoxI family protein [Nocardioides sp.]